MKEQQRRPNIILQPLEDIKLHEFSRPYCIKTLEMTFLHMYTMCYL